MQIHRVEIKNFRLLTEAQLVLEKDTTVIVGRNNSGKTSLSEVMRRLLSEHTPTFQLEDFSNASYEDFCSAFEAYRAGQDEVQVRSFLPYIQLRILFHYDPAEPQLGPLSPFVIDLDPNCSQALVIARYEVKSGQISKLFEGLPNEALTDETKRQFFRVLRERLPAQYAVRIWAEDPNDATNQREMPTSSLRNLVKTDFINAQRGLDDVTSKESDVLAKVLENLFATANSPTADDADRAIADALKTAVQDIQNQIDADFAGQLKSLIPTLNAFGYPGLGGQELHTETTLDVRKLLSNFTKVRYAGHSGVALPETYNGLGVRNLIFILLQLIGFYKEYRAEKTAPGTQLIFIEEPEAHLHPQMQEVFIRQLSGIVKKLLEEAGESAPWPVQFVVSTHSSHIANQAGFERIRYFLGTAVRGAPAGVRQTKVKDLRVGLGGTPEADKVFMRKYLTLTRCDLFFADKAVLVEGLSERVLFPVIVEKIEADEPDAPKLSNQYVTTMEVGGAYAHVFFGMLDFLELRSLVITDLDSVLVGGGKACPVHQGTATSNACLKSWFENDSVSPTDLVGKTDEEKIKGRNKIAFQCPEIVGGPCGRTFEDAFILANQSKFGITGANNNELEIAAREMAAECKKSEFALKYAIQDKNWTPPRYIRDGIRWLANNDPPLTDAMPLQGAATNPSAP